MNKFNKAQHHSLNYRRARKAVRKRLESPHPSLKLSQKPPPAPISGKRQRKLEKQWRRAQKEAIETGLVTMQDIEMLAAENLASGEKEGKQAVANKASGHRKHGFHIKQKKFFLKQRTSKGRDGNSTKSAVEDPMLE